MRSLTGIKENQTGGWRRDGTGERKIKLMDGWGRGGLRGLGVGEKRIKLLVGEEVSAFH